MWSATLFYEIVFGKKFIYTAGKTIMHLEGHTRYGRRMQWIINGIIKLHNK